MNPLMNITFGKHVLDSNNKMIVTKLKQVRNYSLKPKRAFSQTMSKI